jgi:hypothetical protein
VQARSSSLLVRDDEPWFSVASPAVQARYASRSSPGVVLGDLVGAATCGSKIYTLGTWYLVVTYRGNGGIHRGIYQLQGDANGHVGRPR